MKKLKIKFYVCLGGPGSNKSLLCQRVLRANTDWGHVSMGPSLRSLATSQESLQEAISSGKIVDEVICLSFGSILLSHILCTTVF